MNEYLVKIKREEESYFIQVYQDGNLLAKKRIHEPLDLKKSLAPFENKISCVFSKDDGSMNFFYKNPQEQGIVEFENYREYKHDFVFQEFIQKVNSKLPRNKRVSAISKAKSELIAIAITAFLGVTTLGLVGYTFLAFDNPGPVNIISDQSDQPDEEAIEAIPVAVSEEPEVSIFADDDLDNVIGIYEHPVFSEDYNIYLHDLAEEYAISYEDLLAIAYVESGGNFNNNGVVSATNDYGVFQINEGNFEVLQEELGYTPNQILYDDYANAECAAFLLSDICKRNVIRNGIMDEVEMFREYNGGSKFYNIPVTLVYATKAIKIKNELYTPEYLKYIQRPTTEKGKGM